MFVPVTAVSEPGINTVFVNVDYAFFVSWTAPLSILGE